MFVVSGRIHQFSQCHCIDCMGYGITYFRPKMSNLARAEKATDFRHLALCCADHRSNWALQYTQNLAHSDILWTPAEPPLVTSTRGAHGGYQLSRSPQNITMGEILRVLEGPIAPMICATEGEMTEICGFLV